MCCPRFPRGLVVIALLVCAVAARLAGATRVATMTLTGDSIRVSPAAAKDLSGNYSVSFSTTDDGTINDELYQSGGTDEYGSIVIIDYPGAATLGPIRGVFDLFIPSPGDRDVNGITDFLEVTRAIAGETSTGTIEVDDGMDVSHGTVAATWTRAAGSSKGTVRMKVNLADFGIQNLVFTHVFEIFQYSGSLKYDLDGTNVTATVNLPRLGGGVGFVGSMPMGRVDSRTMFRYDTQWKGPGGFDYDVLSTSGIEDVDLNITYVTHSIYGGVLVFQDGNPATPFQDEYDYFDVIITDPNDANGNGLPDLSDPVTVAPPKVAWAGVGGSGKIGITGEPGALVAVEGTASLVAPVWAKVGEATLDPAGAGIVDVGVPSQGSMFFRARVP